MIKSLFLTLNLFLFSQSIHAAPCPCMPFEDSVAYLGSSPLVGATPNGYFASYSCHLKVDINAPIKLCTILVRKDYASLTSIAGKVTTALSSPTSFASSWKRNVTLPITDPSLDLIRADFNAFINSLNSNQTTP
jgi:hypothetical protein